MSRRATVQITVSNCEACSIMEKEQKSQTLLGYILAAHTQLGLVLEAERDLRFVRGRKRKRKRRKRRREMVGSGGREVCESCIEGVITEMVSTYSSGKPNLAARRIEAIGFQVGHQLCDRYTIEKPRFTDHLDAIKFICKDFWSELFKKQIDNLKTNHRGTFVLQDNKFRWLMRIPVDSSMENTDSPPHRYQPSSDSKATQAISLHLYFPCGIIRGALSNLGIPCAVSADISNLPACSFVIRIKA